jgi:hypothetical protein
MIFQGIFYANAYKDGLFINKTDGIWGKIKNN